MSQDPPDDSPKPTAPSPETSPLLDRDGALAAGVLFRLLQAGSAAALEPDTNPLPLGLRERLKLAALPLDEAASWGGRERALPIVLEPARWRPPRLWVWAQRDPPALLHVRRLSPDDDPDLGARDALVSAMLHPDTGAPRRPARVLLSDTRLAQRLAPLLDSLDIALETAPDAVSDALMREATEGLTRSDGALYGALAPDGVAPHSVGRLMELAAQLPARAWDGFGPDLCLTARLDAYGLTEACVVIPSAYPDGALHMFTRRADFAAWHKLHTAADSLGVRLQAPHVPHLRLGWRPAHSLPLPLRKLALRHGWAVHSPAHYPALHAIDASGRPQRATPDDFLTATACVQLALRAAHACDPAQARTGTPQHTRCALLPPDDASDDAQPWAELTLTRAADVVP